MSVKVNFLNGESIIIEFKTRVYAWNSVDKEHNGTGYYANMVFEGSNFDGTEIGTSDPIVGLQGLFGKSDWFSIQDDRAVVYKTSAILSLEDY